MNSNDKSLTHRVALRRVAPDDEDFLIEVYFTTRDDLASLPLPDEQKHALIRMQYEGQKQGYELQYPDKDHYIVLFDKVPVGRYMLERRAGEILGIDLAILPEHRSRGIGSVVMGSTLDEAMRTDRRFVFHVLKSNQRAIALYLRLGFVVSGDLGSHFEMHMPLSAD